MAAVAALGTGAGLVYSSSGPAHRERQLHLNVNSHSLSKCNDTVMIRSNSQVATACLTSGLTTSSVGR